MDDGSFLESSGDSSDDDEQEAVVDNAEVSLIQFKYYCILTSLHHKASQVAAIQNTSTQT
jgi:hypothetical protein